MLTRNYPCSCLPHFESEQTAIDLKVNLKRACPVLNLTFPTTSRSTKSCLDSDSISLYPHQLLLYPLLLSGLRKAGLLWLETLCLVVSRIAIWAQGLIGSQCLD